ncbi:MAG: hypothetical protein EOP06_21690 [Proteobacteria bacterium]|nr:MAG: hypothetical protein EOP06_21690 [Pseudomonadota bacterium]
MDILRVFISSIFGVIVMTAFSYLYAAVTRKPFREPHLLNHLFKRWRLQQSLEKNHLAGHLAHYFIGFAFALLYEILWVYTPLPVTWAVGVLLGIVSGIVGVIAWKIMFSNTDRPPKIEFQEYYAHLVIAHVCFALGVVSAYKLWFGS